ncbi:hypothetical protein ABZ845_30870 [Streptomyces sp. NPDC047022]|uniref:hypothetical protein n=1 Tax=Streptomyces sp. NPDC047022 TaxID=3155737 RepID=UPI0033C38926
MMLPDVDESETLQLIEIWLLLAFGDSGQGVAGLDFVVIGDGQEYDVQKSCGRAELGVQHGVAVDLDRKRALTGPDGQWSVFLESLNGWTAGILADSIIGRSPFCLLPRRDASQVRIDQVVFVGGGQAA